MRRWRAPRPLPLGNHRGNGWRGSTSIEKRIEYDLYYIERWSVGLDLKILLQTFWHGFRNRNAY